MPTGEPANASQAARARHQERRAARSSRDGLELRELFNVCWHPSSVTEGLPAAPDVQSLPGGIYGNIFDVLVDRPERAKAIFDYPVVWAAGDVELGGGWTAILQEYLRRGGTLVVNIEAAQKLPADLIGLAPTGQNQVVDVWTTDDGRPRACVPYELAGVELKGAETIVRATQDLPLVTRHRVGAGAVLVTLAPHMLGQEDCGCECVTHGYSLRCIVQ